MDQLNRFHCAYHKCLTIYFSRVMSSLYNRVFRRSGGYRQHRSLIEDFYSEVGSRRVMGVNNHVLDFSRLGDDFRISRFIRDPRDMIVSGLHYHRRGAEKWCNITDPTEQDFAVVNGELPEAMQPGMTYATYLQSLNEEQGLIAEIDFRKRHYQSMTDWPEDDGRIILFRYEDIMGNEVDVFKKIFDFYELPWLERKFGAYFADRFSAKRQRGKMRHIRDPKPNQWKQKFTPAVEQYFNDQYEGLLRRYGYDIP